jgi:hypothetical protein
MISPSGSNVMKLLAQVAPSDMGLSGQCPSENIGLEIAEIAQQCAASTNASLNADCLRQIVGLANSRWGTNWQLLHQYYASYCAALIAYRNQKPNAAVTLYGDNAAADAVYAANTPTALTPRQGNTIQSAFTFNSQQMFFQLITSDEDVANGWRFVGGSVKFAGDTVSGMLSDVSFDVFGERAAGLDSPLQTYMYRSPDSSVQFTASAFNNVAAGAKLIGGATLLLLDMECRSKVRGFRDSLFEADFAQVVQEILVAHRGACTRGGPIASPFPGGVGMPVGGAPSTTPRFW